MSINCKTHRRCGDKAVDGSCMRDAECENQIFAGSDKAKFFNATDLAEQTIKDQATEIEQLKAQNMAMSEVVYAAMNWDNYASYNSKPNKRLLKAVATYKQTIEG